MIFWVSVIAIWHVDMFPRFFAEDRTRNLSVENVFVDQSNIGDGLLKKGALRPSFNKTTLPDRSKYSRRSLVIADFSSIDSNYGVNRLYTSIMISLGAMSFIILSYGLQSGFTLVLPST